MDNTPEANGLHLPIQEVENKLHNAAISFTYPETPDIAAKERQRLAAYRNGKVTSADKKSTSVLAASRKTKTERRRRMGLAFAVIAALIIGTLLITPVRAQLIEWLRIGAVRIFLNQPKPTLEPTQPSALDNLAGATTLAKAIGQVPFQLMIPSYPPDLGNPQQVYIQERNSTPVVIFIWQDAQANGKIRLALYQIGVGDVFDKQLWQDMQETTVNGHWALWVEGPYVLLTKDGQTEQRRIVQGRTLIWVENEITYRLETSLSLDEARKIAESLKPISGK